MVAGLARRCARRASKRCSLPSGLSRGARPYFLLPLLEVTRGGVFWIVAVGPAKWAIRALRLLGMGFLSVWTRRAATVAGNKTRMPARPDPLDAPKSRPIRLLRARLPMSRGTRP